MCSTMTVNSYYKSCYLIHNSVFKPGMWSNLMHYNWVTYFTSTGPIELQLLLESATASYNNNYYYLSLLFT